MDLRALYPITYGLYLVGSAKDNKINAQIANTVIQVCSEPPTISVCINKGNLTHDYIMDSRVFSVSVLAQDTPLNFIGTFGFKSGRDINKFLNIPYKMGETKAPIVEEHALSVMEARVVNEADTRTHTIFVGELVAAEMIKEGEPMTYAYYRQVKRGTTPKSAPSYIEAKKQKEEERKLAKYKCSVCGYIYDPDKGDPDNGIQPGTPFEKLPEDWTCPVCGASKSEFEKL